ncbi:T9SS type A sorting domain-containing protein [Aquirufa rosea]|uniref:T9SS type A sorting domain-containing protein n=1 Tax=Aquirufa rosea TaxID=2509241 RepID=A0A4Q1BZU7_9BACT|nr:T9SS type A sorting domain-containing protein [Aquirufa rosea]RXK49629.1 T9SS type A sorting domain-containing protein [Aquirufa rosea]
MKQVLILVLSCVIHWEIFGQCPVIQTHPASQSDCDGNSIRMIVKSDGDTFQWEKKRPGDANFSLISGATSPNYQIYPTGGTSNPSGTLYRVKITKNSCQVYSQEASITLHAINSILNPSICERATGKLIPQIPETSSSQILSFQWTRSINGGPFEDMMDDTNFSGTKTRELSISNASMALNSQKIKVRINFIISPNNDNEGSLTNDNQSSTCPRTSSEVSLQIKNAPIPTHASNVYKGCIDGTISVNSTGCSPYSTFWYDTNGQKLGEGARLSVILPNNTAVQYKATCFKNGCESLPSLGTYAQAFPIPAAPSNSGTPSQVCSGSLITFKASGGSNNIWYINSTDKSPISTATSIQVSQVNSSQNMLEITRWVSQKVNECESNKTAIRVNISPSILADAGENKQVYRDELYETGKYLTASQGTPPYSYTWSAPTSTPITNSQASNPTIGPFRSSGYVKLQIRDQSNCIAKDSVFIQWENQTQVVPTDSVSTPTIPTDSTQISDDEKNESLPNEDLIPPLEEEILETQVPQWHEISYTMEPLCQQDAYKILVSGCPGNVMYFNQFGPEQLRAQGAEWIVDARYELFVQVRCSDPNSNKIDLRIPPLKKPIIPIIKNFEKYVCENQIAQIEIDHAYKNQFIGWEKDGHFFSEAFILHQILEAGEYQAIIQNESCFYRSELLVLEVKALPQSPHILSKKSSLCLRDSTSIYVADNYPYVRWKHHERHHSFTFKAQKPGNFNFQAQISLDQQCWSDWSAPFSIQVHEQPEAPKIIATPALGFCEGDSIQLMVPASYHQYEWNTLENKSAIHSKKPGKHWIRIQNQFNCWSNSSDTLQSYYYPEMPKPSILAFPSRQFCAGDSIILLSSNAHTYQWKNGSNTSRIGIKESGNYWLKVQNSFGCWSKNSDEISVYRREKPMLPALKKSGIYFAEAISLDKPDEYEWLKDQKKYPSSLALIKIQEAGLYQVRAKKKFSMNDGTSIECFSPFQAIIMSIPEDLQGISIFPNPNKNGILRLELLENLIGAEAIILNLQGNELIRYPLPSSVDPIKLQLPDLPAGSYILKIIANNYQKEKIIILTP